MTLRALRTPTIVTAAVFVAAFSGFGGRAHAQPPVVPNQYGLPLSPYSVPRAQFYQSAPSYYPALPNSTPGYMAYGRGSMYGSGLGGGYGYGGYGAGYGARSYGYRSFYRAPFRPFRRGR